MHKVEFNGGILFAQDGQLLSEVLMKNNKYTEHLCGGKGVCKKCTVTVNGREELSCRYAVHSDIVVKSNPNSDIYSFTGITDSGDVSENMCYCLDIGTTTLALSLVSLDEKKAVKTVTATNPQRVFGADVLSRIEYCRKNGIKELNTVLIQTVNSMINELGSYSVKTMFVAGNTTMLHTFFGEDCSSIGEFPYEPVFLNSREVSGESSGISNTDRVVSLPSIHSFVGADIVAGLNFVEIPEDGKFNLLVDLGTNAEIVLFSKDSVLCASAAAGPCFEGGNISCGMSAVKGAIYSYKKGSIKTVDNAVPSGVCATGLVDIVATLLDDGIIDETGYMEEDFEVSYNVVLTQQDVREYQLAKSSVYSGICSLAVQAGIGFENIEKVYVSGGFSHELNVSNAVKTGLFPKELLQKCVTVNNSCLQGIMKCALENNDLSHILKNGVYVDLAQNNDFSRLFVENMMFKLT